MIAVPVGETEVIVIESRRLPILLAALATLLLLLAGAPVAAHGGSVPARPTGLTAMGFHGGIALDHEIVKYAPETRVLMLTASTAEDAIVEAVAAGATGYLQKDTDREQLLSVVRNVALGNLRLPSEMVRRAFAAMQGGGPGWGRRGGGDSRSGDQARRDHHGRDDAATGTMVRVTITGPSGGSGMWSETTLGGCCVTVELVNLSLRPQSTRLTLGSYSRRVLRGTSWSEGL